MNPWPISPLTEKDLTFVPVNYDFTGLAASELSATQALLDAIDATLTDFGTSVADQTVEIASWTGDLLDLDQVLNELATDDFEQVAAELAKAAAAGDGLLNDFVGLF
jgi:hypothetical protein